jgi:kumamolisin
VDFPASSPNVLACGGTKLLSSGGTINSEVVWNETATGHGATGGGVSDFFGVPSYQTGVNVPISLNGSNRGRGVPDVAGNADPDTGYQIRVDGQNGAVGGTSAVAPLYAGLAARLNQQRANPVGFLNPIIYNTVGPKGGFTDITEGDNGVSNANVKNVGIKNINGYPAQQGWDCCTGWGSPIGANIANLL